MVTWNKIEPPRGTFVSWGKVGQQVTLKVVHFDPVGGSDFNSKPCPQLVGNLTEDADNYRDIKSARPTHEVLKAGDLVTINAGQDNLKKALLVADPSSGDLVRITFEDTEKLPNGNEVKRLVVEHAPGGGADQVGEDDL